MEVHGYNADGSISATFDGEPAVVPDDLANRHRQLIAAWEALGNTIPPYVPPSAALVPLTIAQIACARLQVDGLDITGIERSQGIDIAFMLDADTAWIFFSEVQADTNYIVLPGDGATKQMDYIEVVRPGMTDLSLIVQRVQ